MLSEWCRKRDSRPRQMSEAISRLSLAASLLLASAIIGNLEVALSYLFSSRGSSSSRGDSCVLLFCIQCSIDNLEEMMKLLVEYGADVSRRDSELWTPLHAAATCGHVRICRYLSEQ